MQHLRKHIAVFLFLLIGTSFVSVTGQVYSFSEFGTRAGLPNMRVNDITQDSLGYLWIATHGGVARFNGQTFITYTEKNGLVNNKCLSLFCDSKQRLWIGTEDGVSVFSNERFYNLNSDNGLHGTAVLSINEIYDEIILATNNGGVNRLKFESDSFSVSSITQDDGLISNFIFDILVDKYNRLWVSELSGINVIDFIDSTYKIENLHHYAILPPSDYYIDLEMDPKGVIWFSTRESGVFRISNHKELSFLNISNYRKEDGLNTNTVVNIQVASDETIWLATYNGLGRIHNNVIQKIQTANGLKYSQIFDVFEDRDKNIWIGTAGNGLLKYQGDHLVKYYIPPTNNSVINDIHCFNTNHLLVSDESGIYQVEIQGDVIKPEKTFEELQEYVTNVTSVDIDKKNDLWIGTTKGLLCLTEGNKLSRYTQINSKLLSNTIYCVKVASDGSVYIGSDNEYNRFYKGSFKSLQDKDDQLPMFKVFSIVEDLDSNIFLGTDIGLIKLHWKSDSVTTYDELEGLNDIKISTLQCDYDNNIWIGTDNSTLYVFPKKNRKSKQIKQVGKGGLDFIDIQSIQFINKYTLVVTSSNGFTRIRTNANFEIVDNQFYGAEHGFSEGKVKPNAICLDNNQQVWIATTDGLCCYRPKFENHSLRPPTIDIARIEVDQQPLSSVNLEPKFFTGETYLELPHSVSEIKFFANGGSLNQPYPVKYSYYCEDMDLGWAFTESPEIRFNLQSPGYYKFHLKAIDNKGIWSDTVTYYFRIIPPFWQTWWFISLMIILGLILVYLFMKYRTRKLRYERDKLEQTVQERTAEIKQQRDIVTQKNKEIEDSITYAKRIQQALLDVSDRITQTGIEHFIFFRPRDIVSGDYYWCNGDKNEPIITVADCTGHGVPGAFMSLLGINYLNRIVNELQITQPDEVLNRLRDEIIKSLNQEYQPLSLRDGMDMTLIKIIKAEKKLLCAGAYNSLFRFRNGELTEVKVNRFSVSVSEEMTPFELHMLDIEDGDILYMYTDGYKDQLGGPREKKINSKQFKQLLTDIHLQPMDKQFSSVAAFFDSWKANYDQVDDVCVMGIKYKS